MYLADLEISNVRTVQDIVDFNIKNAELELPECRSHGKRVVSPAYDPRCTRSIIPYRFHQERAKDDRQGPRRGY